MNACNIQRPSHRKGEPVNLTPRQEAALITARMSLELCGEPDTDSVRQLLNGLADLLDHSQTNRDEATTLAIAAFSIAAESVYRRATGESN